MRLRMPAQVLEAVPLVDEGLGQTSAELLSDMSAGLAGFQAAISEAETAGAATPAAKAVATYQQTVARVRTATESLATKLLAGLEADEAADSSLFLPAAADSANSAAAGGANMTAAAAIVERSARSANLNITVQARPPAALTARIDPKGPARRPHR